MCWYISLGWRPGHETFQVILNQDKNLENGWEGDNPNATGGSEVISASDCSNSCGTPAAFLLWSDNVLYFEIEGTILLSNIICQNLYDVIVACLKVTDMNGAVYSVEPPPLKEYKVNPLCVTTLVNITITGVSPKFSSLCQLQWEVSLVLKAQLICVTFIAQSPLFQVFSLT